jgi:hypothetical protein
MLGELWGCQFEGRPHGAAWGELKYERKQVLWRRLSINEEEKIARGTVTKHLLISGLIQNDKAQLSVI